MSVIEQSIRCPRCGVSTHLFRDGNFFRCLCCRNEGLACQSSGGTASRVTGSKFCPVCETDRQVWREMMGRECSEEHGIGSERRVMTNLFNYTEKDLYELMDRQGKKRFGSECKHEHTRGSYCLDCLRRVVTKRETGIN